MENNKRFVTEKKDVIEVLFKTIVYADDHVVPVSQSHNSKNNVLFVILVSKGLRSVYGRHEFDKTFWAVCEASSPRVQYLNVIGPNRGVRNILVDRDDVHVIAILDKDGNIVEA